MRNVIKSIMVTFLWKSIVTEIIKLIFKEILANDAFDAFLALKVRQTID